MTIKVSKQKVFNAIQFILLVAVLGLLIWSQPWNKGVSATTRKITVTGQATIEATPDKYTFYPYFEAKGTDQKAMKETLTTQANEAVAKLKELGVKEDNLKLDLSSFGNWYWAEGEEGSLTASLTIDTDDKDLSQKIQDYLLSGEAKGQLTAQATFSDEKQKELDRQVSDKAADDAKAKAEQQASHLGAKVGKLIEVGDSGNIAFPVAYDNAATMSVSGSAETIKSSVPVLVGQNEYTKTVTVTFELK